MSLQELQNRLSKLADLNKQTLNLITRLSKLPFQPGSLSLQTSASNPDVRVELSQEIHQSLKRQTETLELLQQEIDDFNPGSRGSEREREKARLQAHGSRLSEDLKLARTQFRKAQLSSKRNAEAAKQKERELLFAGASEGGTERRRKGQEKLSQDELLVSASSDVTAALRRTHQLMQSELSRSQFAHDTLEQSTAALATLGETYGTLSDLLKSSRNLLSSLLRSQKSDTWYLESAFYILLSTIVWLIFRRLLYGPLWWTLWLPLKLSYRLFVGFLSVVGLTNTKSSQISAIQSSGAALSIETSVTANMQQGSGTPAPDKKAAESSGLLLEKVGKMAEDSRTNAEQEKKVEEEDKGFKPNPKKRVWNAESEAAMLEERKRDEL